MQDHLKRAGEALVRLHNGADLDDAAQASYWDDVRSAARGALAELDITVIDTDFDPDELDAVIPLVYGWASTPGEVEVWCESNGLPYFYQSGHVWIEFECKPDDELRQALKDSGFRGRRSGREYRWEHSCHGSWPNSKSGKAKAHREAVDAELLQRKAGAA